MTSLVSMLKHMLMACVLIVVDLMVFWVFDVLHYHAQAEIVVRGKRLWVIHFLYILMHFVLALLIAYIIYTDIVNYLN